MIWAYSGSDDPVKADGLPDPEDRAHLPRQWGGNGRIDVFDASGEFHQGLWLGGSSTAQTRPRALRLISKGNLYVFNEGPAMSMSQNGSRGIQKFDTDGNFISGAWGESQPLGRIAKINPSGNP